ncbi:hypothetical protein, partial [Rubrivirga sp.]|uniref:hypothetical protein n=1 Tax=Rubrivirga sp. TaxID=1885344 RepID=UPI003C734787
AWYRALGVVRPFGLVALALALAFAALGTMLTGRRRSASGLAVVAAFAVGAASFAVWESTRPLGVVVTTGTSLSEGPSTSTASVARVSEGETLEVGPAVDGWRPARLGRARGWVRADAVELI